MDRTPVSCFAGKFFTIWATREAHLNLIAIFFFLENRYDDSTYLTGLLWRLNNTIDKVIKPVFESVWLLQGFPGGSEGKRLPAMLENGVWSLGREDPLQKEMAAHSGILA